MCAAHAQAGLREVVGAEAEEVGALRGLVGGERAARDFNHRADRVTRFQLLLGLNFLGHAVNEFGLEVEFTLEFDERDHDFGLHLDAGLLDFGGGLEDGAGLHPGDFGIHDAESVTAEAEHRIELVEFFHALHNLHDGQAISFTRYRCEFGENGLPLAM
jgi:hypothetical protein